jgi:hypothetical protein
MLGNASEDPVSKGQSSRSALSGVELQWGFVGRYGEARPVETAAPVNVGKFWTGGCVEVDMTSPDNGHAIRRPKISFQQTLLN